MVLYPHRGAALANRKGEPQKHAAVNKDRHAGGRGCDPFCMTGTGRLWWHISAVVPGPECVSDVHERVSACD